MLKNKSLSSPKKTAQLSLNAPSVEPMPESKNVFFGNMLFYLYTTRLGLLICRIARTHMISKLIGWYYSSSMSRRHIKPFIRRFNVNMEEAELPVHKYRSFNDFFTRKLKKTARAFSAEENVVFSPCDGTVTIYTEISQQATFFAKDCLFSLSTFLGDAKSALFFDQGTLFLFRLAPHNYHRYHFPVSGIPQVAKSISGALDAVHPVAWRHNHIPLLENERHCTFLNTNNFGRFAIVAIGALSVGKIIETYVPDAPVNAGAEMGYFAFGGSMIALLIPKNVVCLSSEITERSKIGIETKVQAGEVIAWRR